MRPVEDRWSSGSWGRSGCGSWTVVALAIMASGFSVAAGDDDADQGPGTSWRRRSLRSAGEASACAGWRSIGGKWVPVFVVFARVDDAGTDVTE